MTDQAPTRGCARCGSCCFPVTLSRWAADTLALWTTQRVTGVPDPGTDEGWAYWRANGWDSDDEASRQRAVSMYDPDGSTRHNADFAAAHWTRRDGEAHDYDCDRFDPDTRLCTAQDSKPPICANFPWYGQAPTAERAVNLDPQCSFLGDIAPAHRPEGSRPLIPIEVVRR
jgi:Fe-S-cluster containining protein